MLRQDPFVGNFDLDPTRTLDIFLDTFSDQLTEHYQFFLDFLAVSPWAPKSKRAGAGAVKVDDGDVKGKQKELPVEADLQGEEGSDTIAQILGFKFGYYQVSKLLPSALESRSADVKLFLHRRLTRDLYPRTFI